VEVATLAGVVVGAAAIVMALAGVGCAFATLVWARAVMQLAKTNATAKAAATLASLDAPTPTARNTCIINSPQPRPE